MSSQPKEKKRKAVAPSVIRAPTARSSVGPSHRSQAQRSGKHTESSDKTHPSARVHPTMKPATYKTATQSKTLHVSLSSEGEQEQEDSEDGEADKCVGESKGNGKEVDVEDVEDDDDDDGEDEAGVEASDTEDEGLNLGSRKSNGKRAKNYTILTNIPLAAYVSFKTPASVNTVSVKVEDKGIGAYRGRLLRAHVRGLMLSMCELDQAQDAAKIKPRFDAVGKPIHLVNGILVPHPSNPFKAEWRVWGEKLVKLARDIKRMESSEREILLSASVKEIEEAVRTGVWSTMVRSWKHQKDGDLDAWLGQRRESSRQSGYKSKKSDNRTKALHSSSLDIGSFEAVLDPYFQSDEEIDPSNKSRRIVKVPRYRTEDCTNFLVALDVAYNGNKARRGNQKYAEPIYRKVNVKVPRLKSGVDIPRWTISKTWEAENPDLELESRQYIETEATGIPQIDQFRQFLHRYAPRSARVYEDEPPAAATSVDPEPEPEPEPAATSTTEEPQSIVGLVQAPVNPAPLPISASLPTSQLVVHQDSANTFSTPLAGSSANAPVMAPALYPAPPQPPNHGAAPPSLGPPPGLQSFLYPPNNLGQFTMAQTADGKWIQVRVGYQQARSQLVPPPQPAAMYGGGSRQGTEVPAAYANIVIDPDLENSSVWSAQPNYMPPPPPLELNTVVPGPPGPDSASPAKAKKRTRNGNGGEGNRKRKAKKSKEVIEDEVDDTGEGPPVAGPSRLPYNAGKPSRIHIKVKGT